MAHLVATGLCQACCWLVTVHGPGLKHYRTLIYSRLLIVLEMMEAFPGLSVTPSRPSWDSWQWNLLMWAWPTLRDPDCVCVWGLKICRRAV